MTLTRFASQIAHVIVLAFGWRRAAIALLAGAASALAMAPFNAWPILFMTGIWSNARLLCPSR